MHSMTIDRVRRALNADTVRRHLIRYFVDKGFADSFDRHVDPLLVQDIGQACPGLGEKLEIEPHAVHIDPTTSEGRLGWNLYVLGNQRMYLGETIHQRLADLAHQIKMGVIRPGTGIRAMPNATPRRIVEFIVRVLDRDQDGYVNLQTPVVTPHRSPNMPQARGYAQQSQWYSRAGYGV